MKEVKDIKDIKNINDIKDIKNINAFIQEAPYRYKYGLFLNFTNFAPWSECTWFERE